jgi:transketolase C-terminal domain/subunit
MGIKRFRVWSGIGRSKYMVSSHDGVTKHQDGSDFDDIALFRNKKDLKVFTDKLKSEGYKEE